MKRCIKHTVTEFIESYEVLEMLARAELTLKHGTEVLGQSGGLYHRVQQTLAEIAAWKKGMGL